MAAFLVVVPVATLMAGCFGACVEVFVGTGAEGGVSSVTLEGYASWVTSLTAMAFGVAPVYFFVSEQRSKPPASGVESSYAVLFMSLMPYLSQEVDSSLRCVWSRGAFRITLFDGREAVLVIPLPQEGEHTTLRLVVGEEGDEGLDVEFEVRDLQEASLRLIDFLERHLPERVRSPVGALDFELVAVPHEPLPVSSQGAVGANLRLTGRPQVWLDTTLDAWPLQRRYGMVVFWFGVSVPVALVLAVCALLDLSRVDQVHFMLRAVPLMVFPALFELEHMLNSRLPKELRPQWPVLELLRVDDETLRDHTTGQSLVLGGPWGVRLYRDPVRVDVLGFQIVSAGRPDSRLSFRVPCRVPDGASLEALDVRGPMLNASDVARVLWPTIAYHLALRGETLPWSWVRRHDA